MYAFKVELGASISRFALVSTISEVPHSGSDEPGCENLAVKRVQLMTFEGDLDISLGEYVWRYVE